MDKKNNCRLQNLIIEFNDIVSIILSRIPYLCDLLEHNENDTEFDIFRKLIYESPNGLCHDNEELNILMLNILNETDNMNYKRTMNEYTIREILRLFTEFQKMSDIKDDEDEYHGIRTAGLSISQEFNRLNRKVESLDDIKSDPTIITEICD